MRRRAERLLVAPAVFLVRVYQAALSPLLPSVCRFTPTCSEYVIQALRVWGPLRGSWLGLRRILRCRPLGPTGHDPVPERNRPGAPRSGRPAR